MLRFLAVLLATMLIAGCRLDSGVGGNFGSDSLLDSGNDILSTAPLNPESSGGSAGASGSHTPEPATAIIFGIGLAGIAAAKLLSKRK